MLVSRLQLNQANQKTIKRESCRSQERVLKEAADEYCQDQQWGYPAYYESYGQGKACLQTTGIAQLIGEQALRGKPTQPDAETDRHHRQKHVGGKCVKEGKY